MITVALSFVDQELPSEYDRCADFFRRRGAYGRFKDFLESHDVLEKWHAFESQVTEARLRVWCEEHGIQVSPKKPWPDPVPIRIEVAFPMRPSVQSSED